MLNDVLQLDWHNHVQPNAYLSTVLLGKDQQTNRFPSNIDDTLVD